MATIRRGARSVLGVVVLASVLQLPGGTPVSTKTPTTSQKATPSHQARAAFGNLPLSFEANQGQTADPRVKFLSRGSGYSLHLTPTEAVLTLAAPTEAPTDRTPTGAHPSTFPTALEGTGQTSRSSGAVVRMTLVGGSAHPEIIGRDALPGKRHYFSGSDPSAWLTNIPSYTKVD